jgi:hypothetical protein
MKTQHRGKSSLILHRKESSHSISLDQKDTLETLFLNVINSRQFTINLENEMILGVCNAQYYSLVIVEYQMAQKFAPISPHFAYLM